MGLAKVYFYPKIDERFVISTVKAIAMGPVPIVSEVGWHTEFVPASVILTYWNKLLILCLLHLMLQWILKKENRRLYN